MLLVLTTEASLALAESLARQLLQRRLVACVSLQPLCSLYRWQGQLERSDEVQLLLKTDGAHLGELEATVHQLHSYDTPEWLVWPAEASGGYGAWLRGALQGTPPPPSPGAGPAVP